MDKIRLFFRMVLLLGYVRIRRHGKDLTPRSGLRIWGQQACLTEKALENHGTVHLTQVVAIYNKKVSGFLGLSFEGG
jgi:hypothetical protein